jgi:hypothetical protein
MSTQEQARKSMAESRQHNEHLQETMLNRAEEQLDRLVNSEVNQQARKSMVESRQHDKHLQETMLNRSEEEIINSD